jgi:hypothetical protein
MSHQRHNLAFSAYPHGSAGRPRSSGLDGHGGEGGHTARALRVESPRPDADRESRHVLPFGLRLEAWGFLVAALAAAALLLLLISLPLSG